MLRKVSVNTELVEKAVNLGDHRTKQEAATKALEYYIDCLERQQIAGDSGASDINPHYDGK